MRETILKAGGFDLSRRVAVVTGGGRGIGRALALGLADHGAHVAVVVGQHLSEAQEVCDLIRRQGREALAFRADVSDREQVESMTQAVAEHGAAWISWSIMRG